MDVVMGATAGSGGSPGREFIEQRMRQQFQTAPAA